MSAVLVLTPILTPVIIGGWPAITAAVAGVAAAMGLAVSQSAKDQVKTAVQNQAQAELNTVEVELTDSEAITENFVTNEEIVLTKGTVELGVQRDEHGRCVVCASGRGHTDAELKVMAEEFSQRLTQTFMYNRVMSEVKARGFQVMNEEQMEDETVRIHVRRWEE